MNSLTCLPAFLSSSETSLRSFTAGKPCSTTGEHSLRCLPGDQFAVRIARVVTAQYLPRLWRRRWNVLGLDAMADELLRQISWASAKSIIFHTKFMIFNAKFMIFNAKFMIIPAVSLVWSMIWLSIIDSVSGSSTCYCSHSMAAFRGFLAKMGALWGLWAGGSGHFMWKWQCSGHHWYTSVVSKPLSCGGDDFDRPIFLRRNQEGFSHLFHPLEVIVCDSFQAKIG